MARDRLGVKPLHYAMTEDGWLLFGSELKSLMAHGGLRQEIDPRAVEAYFALGYVPDPWHHLQATRKKLAPGHRLLVKRGQAAGHAAALLGRQVHARRQDRRGRGRRGAAPAACPSPSSCA